MAAFESLSERQRRQRGRRRPPAASEWEDLPLGSLGTRLWADIELYLEFLDIARAEPVEAPAQGGLTTVSTRHAAYLRFL